MLRGDGLIILIKFCNLIIYKLFFKHRNIKIAIFRQAENHAVIYLISNQDIMTMHK